MATASMYDRVTKQLDFFPTENEGEQEFLTRLVRKISSLDDKSTAPQGEVAFEDLDEDVQLWSDEGITAIEHKQPIQMIPGSPFNNGEIVEEEEEVQPKPPRRRAAAKAAPAPAAEPEAPRRGRKAAAKAAPKPAEPKEAKPARGTKAAKKAAPAAPEKPARRRAPAEEAPAAPKRRGRQPNSDKGPGVLDLLMVATYHNPSDTPAQLKSKVEAAHKSMVVQEANAIGVRQQYRRIVRFLQRMEKEDKKWDGNVKSLKTE